MKKKKLIKFRGWNFHLFAKEKEWKQRDFTVWNKNTKDVKIRMKLKLVTV